MKPIELRRAQQADQRVRILDVRTVSEFENAHIAGAYNVPLHQLPEHAAELRHAGDGLVVLVCQSGGRAAKAEALLRGAGLPNARVLEGGMNAWLGERLPTARIRKRVSLERQVRMVAGALVALGSLAALMVSSLWVILPLAVGSGLVFAGATDTCAMGMLLARMPYNRSTATCDTDAIVRGFLAGNGDPLP